MVNNSYGHFHIGALANLWSVSRLIFMPMLKTLCVTENILNTQSAQKARYFLDGGLFFFNNVIRSGGTTWAFSAVQRNLT